MQMYHSGRWIGSPSRAVRHPYDGSLVGEVPEATLSDVDAALDSAQEGAKIMRRLSARERAEILRSAAALLRERSEEFAVTITREEGKVLAEARLEVARAAETLDVSAEEAKRITGEVLPLDGAPGGQGKLGFTLRVPCGVVVAISPFNFPLNLVCHKVGPALAAGNAVVLKPASDTPLSALKLVEVLLEAKLPPLGIACLTGPGGKLGQALCSDSRVRKITFTGSQIVGEQICQVAGIKRVTMELGSNCPLIVLPDVDPQRVLDAIIATGYSNAGQVCISTQRVLGVGKAYEMLVEALPARVRDVTAGNPLLPETQMGPMIREADAARVIDWIGEAASSGARILCGGSRQAALVEPTVVADVPASAKMSCEELFGPAVAISRAKDVDEAIHLANDSRYGLAAGIMTRDIEAAMRFAQHVDAGNLHINWGPGFRADMMPYGGLKESGLGKEGPRYAISEMTESKTIIFHGV